MDLETTFRGLDRRETGIATRMLERCTARIGRLVDGPKTLRVVADAAQAEYRVMLQMAIRGAELTAADQSHDLAGSVSTACERLRSQLVRLRHRHESERHRASVNAY